MRLLRARTPPAAAPAARVLLVAGRRSAGWRSGGATPKPMRPACVLRSMLAVAGGGALEVLAQPRAACRRRRRLLAARGARRAGAARCTRPGCAAAGVRASASLCRPPALRCRDSRLLMRWPEGLATGRRSAATGGRPRRRLTGATGQGTERRLPGMLHAAIAHCPVLAWAAAKALDRRWHRWPGRARGLQPDGRGGGGGRDQLARCAVRAAGVRRAWPWWEWGRTPGPTSGDPRADAGAPDVSEPLAVVLVGLAATVAPRRRAGRAAGARARARPGWWGIVVRLQLQRFWLCCCSTTNQVSLAACWVLSRDDGAVHGGRGDGCGHVICGEGHRHKVPSHTPQLAAGVGGGVCGSTQHGDGGGHHTVCAAAVVVHAGLGAMSPRRVQ
jgi:hypothetical protein